MQDALVERELARVVEHEVFARSPRMRALLSFLVREELAGAGESLSERRIGAEALERGPDFDPRTGSLVRVEMSRLRRMLDAVRISGAPGTCRIDIPRGGYRPRFLPANAAAETTPVVRPAASGILVLPLAGAGTGPDVAPALHHLMLHELSRFETLRVFDGSALEGADRSERMRAAVERFECPFLLEGRAQGYEDGVRIHQDLVDATDGSLLWAGRYDGPVGAGELVAYQEASAVSVARAAADRARDRLVGPVRRPDPHARPPRQSECVLAWHAYRAEARTRQAHARLQATVLDALEQDPGFVMGWVVRAQLALDEYRFRIAPDVPVADIAARSAYLAERAVSLAPESAEARHVHALQERFLGDPARYASLLRHALEFAPNSMELLHHGGSVLALTGDWDAGAELVARAGFTGHEGIGYRIFFVLAALRREDAAAALASLGSVAGSGYGYSVALLEAVARAQLGELEGARRQLAQARALEPSLAGDGVREEIARWVLEPVLAGVAHRALDRID